MSHTMGSILSNYAETVPVPEHLPLICLVWYLFIDFDDQKHRAEQLRTIFYGYKNSDNLKTLEDELYKHKPMQECLDAAKQAVIERKIEQYERDYDFERFEQNKFNISEFYTVSFLGWAESAGYSIPENITKELGQKIEYYFSGQTHRDQERLNFPAINIKEFTYRTNEPLWVMTDAILYALGYQSSTNEESKINFLRYKDRAKRLMKYILDAEKVKDLKLYDYDDHLFDIDQKDAEEKRIKSFYASRVKPKEFVEWLKVLTLDIPVLQGNIEKDVELHFKAEGYSTPYIDLMIKAIKELKISNNNQPLKKNILEWFNEQNMDLSKREKDALATFIRLPEMKKGGYHKNNKQKGDTQ